MPGYGKQIESTMQGGRRRGFVMDFEHEVVKRVVELSTRARGGAFDDAIDAMTRAINHGGVIQAFGTGHSEAFAMEIAGRAGGLIPTNRIALRDAVLRGTHTTAELYGDPPLERDPDIADDVFATIELDPEDLFIIASNSGVNGSIVGLALLAKSHGHTVIAVTSLDHTRRVEPKHPSGRRLSEVADIVIDNLAPFGDATLADIGGVSMGAVSSITGAYIAQLLTIGVAEQLSHAGDVPPLYLSANVPGGDDHNHELQARYGTRIKPAARGRESAKA